MAKSKEKKKKDPKRKPKYGMFSCLKWMGRLLWKWEKTIAVSAVLVVPIAVALYWLNTYTPSIVLDRLQTSDTFATVVYTILALLLSTLGFRMIKNYIDIKRELASDYLRLRLYHILSESWLSKDYYLLFDEEFQEKSKRADNAYWNKGNTFPTELGNLAVNIICFVLFGSVISLLSPWVLLLLLVGCLMNFFTQRWKQNYDYRHHAEYDLLEAKMRYTAFDAPERQCAKDLRLYGFSDFISKTFDGIIKDFLRLYRGFQNSQATVEVVSYIVSALRDGLAYAFLIFRAVNGELGPAEFVLYFSAISQMSGFIGGILGGVSSIREGALQLSDFREFLEIQGDFNHGEGIEKPIGSPLSIESKNVSYKYPKGEKNVIDNVSFKIEAGEKIALVGLNGAGKTTLTMLTGGLILPNEGEILIDGHGLLEYNRDDLISLFSVVPQNYTILPLSIAENIALEEKERIDYDKLNKVIEIAGLTSKIASLSSGVNTPLSKEFDLDAVDFSGGEMQRLLLARAVYRGAPILILDEPTAALDPIAEDEIYKKYNDIAKDTTSIFISHRLASTRFCDRIFLLDNNKLAEVGTHDELIKLGGKYKELFDVQSQYYKEGENENEEKQEV